MAEMKKNLLALALSTMIFSATYAQTSGDSGFGIRVAWDLNSPSSNLTDLDNGSGFSAGVFYDVPVYRKIFVEPGVSYFYNTITTSVTGFDMAGAPAFVDGTLRNMGLRIPIYWGYKLDLADDISISLFTGPQMNIGLSLDEHYKKGTIKNLYDKGWNRVDLQWLFGLRFHYLDNFIAEIGGGVGMTNMLDADKWHGFHVRRNTFTIAVGYLF